MRATALLKQAFIRSLGKTARENGVPLYDLILGMMQGHVTAVQGGSKVLVQVQANGISSQYPVPLTGINASGLAELCAELLGVMEEIKAVSPALTDEQVVTQMVTFYPVINATRPDFSMGLIR